MFHRLKSTSPKYQSDCWVKGLTGVERWPLQTFIYGPSPLWLRKEFETAGHSVKGEKGLTLISHCFKASVFCGPLHRKCGLPPPLLVGWPDLLMALFLLQNTNPCPSTAHKCPEIPQFKSCCWPKWGELQKLSKTGWFWWPSKPSAKAICWASW